MHSRRKYIHKKFSTQSFKIKKSIKNIENIFIYCIAIIIIVFSINFIKDIVFYPKRNFDMKTEDIASFKVPHKTIVELKTLSDRYKLNFSQVLTYYSLENDFYPIQVVTPELDELEKNFVKKFNSIKKSYRNKDVKPYYDLIDGILTDLKHFPIPKNFDVSETSLYTYEDTFGAYRKHDSNSIHKGTDILSKKNNPGKIPVISMTDGIVDTIGWSNESGYKIVIKSENGNYYYYEHLDNFADNLSKESKVAAGNLIGYMGNTGYGNNMNERFQVHLHIGILTDTNLTKNELWINPYAFLKYIEYSKLDYTDIAI